MGFRITEQKFRMIIDSTRDGVAIFSSVHDAFGKITDFRFQYINDAWRRICDLPRAEFTGRTMGEALPDSFGIELLEEYVRVVETGRPFTRASLLYEKADQSGNGKARYVDVRAVKAEDGLALIWSDVTEYKRAEAELERFRLNMQTVLDNTAQRFVLFDLEGRVLAVNPAAQRDAEAVYGKPLVEGTRILDFIYEIEREPFKRDMSIVASGQHVRLETPISTSDGDVRWYDLSYSPVFDSNGKVWAVTLTATDITKRRRVEEALRVKEERYELATRAASTGVWEWNLETGEFYLDPNLKAMLGYSDDEIPNDIEKWASYVHSEDRKAVMEAAEAHIAGRTSHYTFEHRMLHRDGSVRWVFVRGAAVRNAQGKAVKMIGTDSDITDRKYIELALQESEERFRAVWEIATNAMMLSDSEGVVLDANPAYLGLYGYPSAQILGRKFSVIFPEGQRERVEQQYRAVFNSQPIPSKFESTIRRADGAERIVESRIAFIYKDGRRNSMLSTIHDITDAKHTQEALLKAHAELTTLLGVSQEIVSTLDLEPLLNIVLKRLAAVIPYDAAAIMTLDDGYFELQAYSGPELPLEATLLRFAVTQIPELYRITHTPDILYVSDMDNKPGLARAIGAALEQPVEAICKYHTWMAVPLTSKGQVIGLLILMNEQADSYSQQTHTLARAFANQVAIAIENARLYHQATETAALAERARLARDLHDSVTQAMYSIHMYTEAARLALTAGKYDVTFENLREVRNMVREAMADLRLIFFSSRPSALEHSDLAGAIQARLEAVESRADFAVEFNAERNRRLSPIIEAELYSVVQEALSNIIKHAQANRVKVDLKFIEDSIILVVQDDGTGFDVESAELSGGLGLRNIRERIERIGGKIELYSVLQEGTTLKIEVNT